MHNATDLLSQLVAIDSINPDLVPGGAGESAIAAFIAAWSRAQGLEVVLQEAAPGRPNVIAIARGSGGGRSLMINAHVDTVGVSGMAQPHQPRIAAGRLYGRGAFDMKAGLAAGMLAVATAAQQSLRGDVLLAAVVDEEYASIGTRALLTQWRSDAAIVTEPTQLRTCVAHKGFVWLEIDNRGVAAHGSRPDLGVDAITRLGPVLSELGQLDVALRERPLHRLLHSGSLHASLISGGQELSSYPARCTVALERRTVPGETTTIVEEQIAALLERCAARDPLLNATLRTTLVREPFEIAEDAAIVEMLQTQARHVLGTTPAIIGDTPWMDAALLSAAGIPTVVFGPSGTGAHAVEEWADLGSVERCAAILGATAHAFCA
ncbi:M20/M25/M40 family metallo-hydrolase [Candidatus Gracilibacteria bacterium]|nr:M20/M25/M40 family metallo-hydrolase [Candidatus Gracilibacteria bacterium]